MRVKDRRGHKRNWHGWAFQLEDGSMCYWAEPYKPDTMPSPGGRWLKVRFVPASRRAPRSPEEPI